MSATPRPPAGISEKDFMQGVMTLARYCGWRTYHTHDSRRSDEGFPDLVMIRAGRLVVAELKRSPKQKPTPAQSEWLKAFAGIGHGIWHVDGVRPVESYLWTPEDWDEIERVVAREKVRSVDGG